MSWGIGTKLGIVLNGNVDLVGLIETFTASLSNNELSAIAGSDRFAW